MKEHPILFSTEMVQAILRGSKTMTRRIIKQQPDGQLFPCGTGLKYWARVPNNLKEKYVKCPYGELGDILWVRETYASAISSAPSHKVTRWYKADNQVIPSNVEFKWKPSMFMPKGFCRIYLEITGIRVERLHSISETDAQLEGTMLTVFSNGDSEFARLWRDYTEKYAGFYTAKESFISLWEKINGKQSVESNPWVWVIEFKKIDK